MPRGTDPLCTVLQYPPPPGVSRLTVHKITLVKDIERINFKFQELGKFRTNRVLYSIVLSPLTETSLYRNQNILFCK